jgi:RHS repeat-associated protein
MVEQARGTNYTEIVYSPTGGKLALMTAQTLQKAFVPLPGGTTAVYTSGLAYYRHSDWLGSSRFASTPSRTKYFDVAYAPYGEDYADSGTLDLNFTGQNQDTVTGLYDFMHREYHPVAGRWIQPDPAGLGASDPANPQTWNRYAYVTNNPLNATDPLGLWRSDAFGFDNSCFINGFVANCGVVSSFASAGGGGQLGVLCPDSVCRNSGYGTKWTVDPDGFFRLYSCRYGDCGFYVEGFVGQDTLENKIAANTATISAYHPSVYTCLAQAAFAAGEDLLGISMLPGTNQDNWEWSSDKLGFVYTGAAEEGLLETTSNGVAVVENVADYVEKTPAAQGEIRQFLRSEGVKVSLKHVSKDAAAFGKWAGRAGKVLAAVTAAERYKKCMD